MRKTIPVQMILDEINSMLKNSDPDQVEIRNGAMIALESVLHKAERYNGFRYLRAEEVVGSPGVNYVNGQPHPDIQKRFEFTDRTRVQYF